MWNVDGEYSAADISHSSFHFPRFYSPSSSLPVNRLKSTQPLRSTIVILFP